MNQDSQNQLKKFESQNRIIYRLGLAQVFLVCVIWGFMAANKSGLHDFLTDPGRDAKRVLARYEAFVPETKHEKDLLEENKALIGMNGIIVKVMPLSFFLIGMFVSGFMTIGASAYQQKILDFVKTLQPTNNEQRTTL